MQIPRRSKTRVTKEGMLFERRIVALRRLHDQRYRPVEHDPSPNETLESRTRWLHLKHRL